MRWGSLLKFKKLKNWNWLDEIQEEVSTHFSGLLMLAKKIYMYHVQFAKYFFFQIVTRTFIWREVQHIGI